MINVSDSVSVMHNSLTVPVLSPTYAVKAQNDGEDKRKPNGVQVDKRYHKITEAQAGRR
jgi:hypothetical protein